ncbi:MAG: NADPH:quinone reductase [Acidobacteria bacterium]|nr:NADPH:quinone reductase [Acidobacteriota bacterium]
MKAIVVHEFGAPEVMRLEDVPVPEPQGTEVLIRVRAVGVNPVETYLRSGNYPSVPALPYTPGKDAAGVVESAGNGVTKWKAGDRVYTANSVSGTYAEYTLVDERDLGKLPENVSFEEGAGIWTPYATSYRALFQKLNVTKRETVLIHGASGGVGIAAVQWSKNAALTVIGTASSKQGQELAREQGADIIFDHSAEGYLNEIKEFAPGGVNAIVEMLANVNLAKDFDVLAMRGRICVVGNRGSLDFNPRLLMGKDATVTGMALYNSTYDERDEIHAAVFDGLSHGYLKPIVSRSMPLVQAPQAHHEIIESKALGKIVLIP